MCLKFINILSLSDTYQCYSSIYPYKLTDQNHVPLTQNSFAYCKCTAFLFFLILFLIIRKYTNILKEKLLTKVCRLFSTVIQSQLDFQRFDKINIKILHFFLFELERNEELQFVSCCRIYYEKPLLWIDKIDFRR